MNGLGHGIGIEYYSDQVTTDEIDYVAQPDCAGGFLCFISIRVGCLCLSREELNGIL